MPRARTTANLVADVRSRVAAPTSDGLQTDSDILSLADQEMRTELAALLMSARSEYWVQTEDIPVVSGTAAYRIPDRSNVMGLRDVTVLNADGYEHNCTQVAESDRYLYSRLALPRGAGRWDFTLLNGQVVLLPTPTEGGYTLRLRYYVRPPRLVLPSSAAPIASFVYSEGGLSLSSVLAGNSGAPFSTTDIRPASTVGYGFGGGYTVQLSSNGYTATVEVTSADATYLYVSVVPPNPEPGSSGIWSAGVASVALLSSANARVNATVPEDMQGEGTLVDIVRGEGMFETLFADLTVAEYVTSPSNQLVFEEVFDTDQIAAFAVNGRQDYVCPAGCTVYPPIPEALYPCLVALTCAAYCEAIGDSRGMQAARAIYERKRESALSMLVPRVDGEVMRPVPVYTPLRSGGRSRRWA